jgi:hypothetical protein
MKNNQEGQKEIQDSVKWMHKLHVLELELIEKNVLVLNRFHQSLATNAHESSNFKQYSDAEVRFEVLSALKANCSIPKDNITVKVENGWVTLNGELPYNYQREAIKCAVKGLNGVKCVTIHIKTKSHLKRPTSKLADFADSIFFKTITTTLQSST